MERKFTFGKSSVHRGFCAMLTAIFVLLGQFAFSHNVTGYTPSCFSAGSAYNYKITATVNSVNSGSRYKWQYKRTSNNTWVCLVDGNNSINGTTYAVTGSSSSGTSVAPLVFTNPTSGLHGVIVRCIISDNADPCTLPSGNTYNTGSNSLNFSINVNNTPCAVDNLVDLGNRIWFDVNNNGMNEGDAAGEYGIANLSVKLYLDANNDNVADGAAIKTTTSDDGGYYMFTDLNPGNYIVGVTPPPGYMMSAVNGGDPDDNINLDNNGLTMVGSEVRGLSITLATGTEPDGSSNTSNTNITYDFGFLPDCSCTTSSSNMLANASFENGTTGWRTIGGGVNFTTGTGYVACGTKNGFNDANGTGTAYVFQEFAATPGTTYTFKGFAGTHTAGLNCNPRLVMTFRRADGSNITELITPVTRDVDVNHNQLEQYTVIGTAPAGTVTMRVHGAIDCNTLKMDAFCLTSNTSVMQLGSRVWYDTNNDGIDNNSEDGIANAVVHLYKDNNNDNNADGAFIATEITDANGYYRFTNLAPGNYIVGVVTPSGYMMSAVNGGDPDNNINFDNNGMITVGAETRGQAITLALGTETDANNSNFNPSYDFGFLPDCSCTTSGSNMLVNASFENGTTGWSTGNSNFTTGTGYVACGTKNGFNDAYGNGTTAYVFQEFSATPGTTYTFKGFAGTHTAGLNCNPRLVMTFRRADGSNITELVTPVTRDVDVNHNQLEQYIVVGTAPAGTVTMRVHGAIDCNTLKMDAFCLNATCTAPATPVVGTVLQPTCSVAIGSVALSGLPPSGTWTISRITSGGVVTTTGTGATTTITNLAPGTYTFKVTNASGCTSAPTNSVTINPQPATPPTPTVNKVNPTCSVATGSFTIASPVGTGYTYSLNNGPYTTATSFTNLAAATTYTIKAKNASGCESSVQSVIFPAQPVTPPAINYTITEGICGAGGTATLIITNLPVGNWTLNYPGGVFNDNEDTLFVTGIGAGNYIVTVTNNDGCTSAQKTVAVPQGNATAKLGGITWNDVNKNGIKDNGEGIFSGVSVSLYKDLEADGLVSGSPIATTTTANISGAYSFSGLCYGNYIVKFGLPNGTTTYVRTTLNNKLGKDNNDSDADPITGNTGSIHLDAGETDMTNDAGYYASSILPVTFGKLSAQSRNCEVYVDFEVLTQKNVKQFVVEYSIDNGTKWSSLATLPAKAENASSYNYSFKHNQPKEGTNLYRVKSVDLDGTTSYSATVAAFSNCSGKIAVSTYPNPVHNVLMVSLSSDLQNVQLQLVDASGKIVLADTKQTGTIRQLNTGTLSVGMYILKVVQAGNVIMTQKVVKD